MTERPGTNKGELAIGLPHPRDRVSDEFVDARRHLLALLNSTE